MIAGIWVTSKNQLITGLTLTDHWYESKNYWRLNDGNAGRIKYSNGEYERIPGNFVYLYGYGDDGSLVRVMRLDIKPMKYPFSSGYKDTGEIYKESALTADAGTLEYEVYSVT